MTIYKDAKLDKDIILDWLRHWYLWGDVGTGKTHNAYALCNQNNRNIEHTIRENEKKNIFTAYPKFILVNWPTLLDKLRYAPMDWSIEKESRQKLEENIIFAKFLVIDDLGAEKMSDYSDDFLMRMIDLRYIRDLYTGFTSNLALGKLPYDDRIVSRIVGMVGRNKFELSGSDRRIK